VSGPVALAILGHPLAYTRSPDLHRAGLEAAGFGGSSVALPTPASELGARLRELAAARFRGANLTIPLKEIALDHLDRVSEAARCSRSVNTVGFSPDGTWGETTDGPGFLDLLSSLGRDPARERAFILGAGGAARSIALALLSAGAPIVVAAARRPDEARRAWAEIEGAEIAEWDESRLRDRLGKATLVIHATPLDSPVAAETLPSRALIVDLRYASEPTAWVREARALGREAYDGLGLLVFQARRSLALWLGRPVPVDPMARVVGWPR
jgi:shikimate dehydrogenase